MTKPYMTTLANEVEDITPSAPSDAFLEYLLRSDMLGHMVVVVVDPLIFY